VILFALWQKLLDGGVYATVSEIGDAENISKSYVSRMLRLALLAPDIVEAILAGTEDQAVMLEQLERPLPMSWEEQRARILEPKTSLAVQPSGVAVPGQSLLLRP
jgi:ParB-like chromosome segregation protein Spo0J